MTWPERSRPASFEHLLDVGFLGAPSNTGVAIGTPLRRLRPSSISSSSSSDLILVGP
jgi:hypothetical protein